MDKDLPIFGQEVYDGEKPLTRHPRVNVFDIGERVLVKTGTTV